MVSPPENQAPATMTPRLLLLAALLAVATLWAQPTAHADVPPDVSPEAAAEASGEGDEGAAAEGEASAGEGDDESDDGPSRGDNRVKDHAIGFGYYFTHMRWTTEESSSTARVNYHAMAVRYAYYIGQREGFGFMINAAATVPAYAEQAGVASNPALNRSYNLLDMYQRHVGFDINFMVGTHRHISDDVVAIGGVGLHVGVLKLNDSERAIHEYIAMGASGVFSLRCQATDILTFGLDTNVSVDFYDAVKHVNALDFAINVGLTLTIGGIVTLGVLMALTAKIDWSSKLGAVSPRLA